MGVKAVGVTMGRWETGYMADDSRPPKATGWLLSLRYWICIAIGIAAAEAVGDAVQPSLGFWPAFAIKIAAGGAGALIAALVWQSIAGRRE
ncbi:MAG TPA: hypothetical protein VMS17_26715 [Gemmataceae bacterium]|nr:hypothetical protein [Gemmataceae bacterium]